MTSVDVSSVAVLLGPRAGLCERHAAAELKTYLQRLNPACRVTIRSEAEGAVPERIRIGIGRTAAAMRAYGRELEALSEDGFLMRSFRSGPRRELVLCGKRDRGTLYAVYAFLERQGCRFFEPYAHAEIVPRRAGLDLAVAERCNPVFKLRELDLDLIGEWNMVEARRLLDWAAKNRLNTVVLVVRNNFWGIFGALKNALLERDLVPGIGGHQMFAFFMLAPEYYRPMIESFPAQAPAGAMNMRLRNTDDVIARYEEVIRQHPAWLTAPGPVGLHDPCLSHPEVVARIGRNLNAFLDLHPEFQFVHFKCGDGFDSNGHCCCARCLKNGKFDLRRYAAVKSRFEEIYFRAVRRIAGCAAARHPAVTLAYTFPSTFGEPFLYRGRLKPADMPANVKYFYICVETERFDTPLLEDNYRNPHCGTANSVMVRHYLDLVGRSGRQAVLKEMLGSGNYSGTLRPAPRVVARNVKSLYRRYRNIYAGNKVFTNMLRQDHAMAWHGFGLNLYVFYRLLWRPTLNARRLLRDYYRQMFGPAAALMQGVYETIERDAGPFLYIVFMHCIDWLPFQDRRRDLTATPSMGDAWIRKFHTSPRTSALFRRRLECLRRLPARIERALAAVKDPAVSERIAMDRRHYGFLLDLIEFKWSLFLAGREYKLELAEHSRPARGEHRRQCVRHLDDALARIPRITAHGFGGYHQESHSFLRIVNAKKARLAP